MTADNQHKQRFDFIELAHQLDGKKMIRNRFVNKNDTEQIARWAQQCGYTDLFTSIEQYEKPDFGSPCICPFYVDIDSPDNLPGTRESTLMLCELLMDRLHLFPDHLNIYFSGRKGFHIVVSCEVFLPSPSPYLLLLYKKMVAKAENLGIRYLDQGVYTKKRIWRLANSINSKSGLYKIPLSYKELRDMDMEGILIMAKQPRSDEQLTTQNPCSAAVEWFRKIIAVFNKPHPQQIHPETFAGGFRKGWRMVHCVRQIEQEVLPDGIRHEMYLALARYYAYLNMHPDEMTERLEALDQRNPIRDSDYIERVVKSGCKHPGFPGCDSILKQYCQEERCFYAKLKAHNNGDINDNKHKNKMVSWNK